MPYYDYHCKECGMKFTAFHRMDAKEIECHSEINKDCNGIVERILSAPMLKFVGKGFYVNDYPKNIKS
jgi:putative FmdB family regulatory protein